ncbi:MAG: hypothetical protein HUJ71_08565, partial [Pseudobutyrivibrio sp.]|nr:hypothetical protein [Pseudobutyrivibrio sp.]
GCFDFQVVIDCTTIDITLYKDFLESDRLFLLWNAKFDLRFFLHKRIVIKNVYDGYLAEKLMWLGYPLGFHNMGLKDAGEEYLGVTLDKSIRGKIHYAGLATDVIEYSANDVKYLEKIREKQLEKLKEKELTKALELENRFVIVLAYIEYCGVRLDVTRWKAKMEKDLALMQSKEEALNNWVVTHFPNDRRFTAVDLQGDLFADEAFDTAPKCTINWNSSKKDVVPLFKELGFDLLVKDKETGTMKESVDAKVIEPQKNKSDIAPIYLDYRGAQKVVSTYGQNFLDQINIDGRIHTNFNQLMDTARLSCGGKNKQTGEDYVNLQNLPHDAETRACFIAEEGNAWISIDYCGQETYLMASIADDKAIIKELTEGSGDIHSLTAYMAYPEIPRDTSIKDIKKKFPNLRQEAKGIEFAINYGGTGNTIAQNKGIPLEEALLV